MKKWMKICLIVLCVLVALDLLAQLFCLRVNPIAVESAVLCTYDCDDENNESFSQVELNGEEIWRLAMLYNLSIPMDKEYLGCPIECDRIEIKFKSGTDLIIQSYRVEQWFIIEPVGYVFDNQLLLDYMQEVLEKHNLPRW